MLIYRPEINGLRALAVMSVLFFHAEILGFEGGFLGVDIFFVISGYLITSIIINDISKGEFDFLKFYIKRARRILPALYSMLLAVSLLFPLISSKSGGTDTNDAIVATIFFISNFFFMDETGYFATNSLTSPLIHTWSLSIEEQYYFILPIILVSIFGINSRNRVLSLFAILLIGSLVWFQVGYKFNPEITFFNPLARSWELLVGSLASLIVYFFSPTKNQFLSSIGLLAVVFSILFLSKDETYLGLFYLAPVIGTATILIFGTHTTVIGKCLSTKLFTFIGLISYSTYLWHQPVLAFSRIYLMDEKLSPSIQLLTIIFTFFIGYFSWRYIEQPFRLKKIQPDASWRALKYILVSSVILLFIGNFGFVQISKLYGKKYLTGNASEQIIHKTIMGSRAEKIIGIKNRTEFDNLKVVRAGKEVSECKILILGDSHAGHLSKGFAPYIADRLNCEIHISTFVGCTPLFGHFKVYNIYQKKRSKKQKACISQVPVWQNFVENSFGTYDLLILSSRWNWLVADSSYERKTNIRMDALVPLNSEETFNVLKILEQRQNNLVVALKETKKILHAGKQKTIILSQPPVQHLDLRDYDSLRAYKHAAPTKSAALTRHNKFKKALLQSNIMEHGNIFYFDVVSEIFCKDKHLKCINVMGKKSLYKDDDHYSAFGSETVAKIFLSKIRDIIIDEK